MMTNKPTLGRYWIIIIACLCLFHAHGVCQSRLPEIRVSELLNKGTITLVNGTYLVDSLQSFKDTVHIRFQLTNDIGSDTTIYYLEGLNEWVEFKAVPDSASAAIFTRVSGRDYYWDIPYDYIYYPTQPLPLEKGVTYQCSIDYKGTGYRPASRQVRLLSPSQMQSNQKFVRTIYYTNHIITYFFIGAILFGFLFFFFLYLKSHYQLFGIYAVFLFLHALYASYQIDIYTKFGELFIRNGRWDDWLSEFLVFMAQALYVQFMIRWMNIRDTNRNVYRIFNGISIIFASYAILFTILYHINSHQHLLGILQSGIRFASIAIQLVVFYLLIFKIKTPVRAYIITGSALMVFFGVIVVYFHNAGWFDNTYLDTIDNGSWYMIGVLAECVCFSMGLGLKYFQMDRENVRLQHENIKELEARLHAEKEAHANANKLADLNQELTNQQLTALRAQMNPHFIFNALNSIQKYIVKGNVDEANSYLSKFSKLQRMILSYCDQNFIMLDKEIDMLQLYLEIEQLRLSHEFTFDITVDEEIEPEEIPIPPMMLQPFVENAIWHGLLPKPGEKKITIHFGLKGNDILHCTVDDNGIGRKAAQKIREEKLLDKTVNRSKGMSLVNSRMEILEKKYGQTFSVNITDKQNADGEGTGTIVEVFIPVVD